MEGDPKYLAPELMLGKFGKPADVFRYQIKIKLIIEINFIKSLVEQCLIIMLLNCNLLIFSVLESRYWS